MDIHTFLNCGTLASMFRDLDLSGLGCGRLLLRYPAVPGSPAVASDERGSRARVVLLGWVAAAVAGLAGLYEAKRSAPAPLAGFGIAACLAGWYLWTRRGLWEASVGTAVVLAAGGGCPVTAGTGYGSAWVGRLGGCVVPRWPGEVPRTFRTVHPLGWVSGKVKYFAQAEEELLAGIQG